ncbi:hypothetical protein DRJ04_06915, partial [Candidatus Aerophobetes bacterium]
KSPPCKRGEEICCARVKSSAEPSSPETDKNKNTIEVKCEQIISGYICRCDYLYVAEPKTGDFTVTVKTEKPIEEANKPTEKSILEEANKKCRKKAEDEGRNIEQIVFVPECEPIIKTTCDVKNFQLPQKVSKAKEWIPYYGDPLFLVYWQKFPIEEDTWTFHTNRWVYAAIILVSAVPIPSIGKIAVKAAGTELGTLLKDIAEREAKRIAIGETESVARREMLEALKNHIKQKGYIKGSIKTSIKGSLAVTAADAVDSYFGKYEDGHEGKLLLKMAGKKPEEFDVRLKEGKPLFIAIKKSLSDYISGESLPVLHFVSPCYLKTMKVSAEDVKCEEYIYNSKKNAVVCNGPELGGENLPECKTMGYLRKGGVASASEAEDPVLNYVESFARNGVPGYVEITEDISTVVLAKGVIMKFDINNPLGREARIVVETENGEKELILQDSGECTILQERGHEGIAPIPQFISGKKGIVDYKGLHIEICFEIPEKEGCKITEDGAKSLAAAESSFWEKLSSGQKYFKKLVGVGCLGYVSVSGNCNENDEVCKALEKIGAEGMFMQYFRYGSRFSVSQILSKIDKYEDVPDYWIELFDRNSDGKVDLIGINNGIGYERKQYISYSDPGTGSFDTVMLKNCRIPEAIIVSDFEKYDDDEHDPNYCFAEQSKTSIALKLGGYAIGIGGALAAGIASGGTALLLMATTGATGAALDIASEVSVKWP